MGRSRRVYYNNAVYHVCIRGNNKQEVLGQEEDREAFVTSLEKYRARFKFKLYGLVVMFNHVHLALGVESLRTSISKIMQALMLSYSQKFRRKYGYVGYVWQGRFKSNVIEGDQYIKNCINYIHNNPVRAKLVSGIADYPFSSYHFYQKGKNPMKKMISVDKFESC